MAKVKVPERIIHLTQQLRERYSCNQNYYEKLNNMLEDYEKQESAYFEGNNEEVIFLRILNDLFGIRYYSELGEGYYYGIPDEKTAKKIKWYKERAYRMHKGETFCENATIRQKLQEVTELMKIINKKSDKRKFNRILSISENELDEMEDITDISGDNQYVKIFLKVETHTEEEIQTSIENILDNNIELSELRFIKEAIEFLYPTEITTYFVIF